MGKGSTAAGFLATLLGNASEGTMASAQTARDAGQTHPSKGGGPEHYDAYVGEVKGGKVEVTKEHIPK